MHLQEIIQNQKWEMLDTESFTKPRIYLRRLKGVGVSSLYKLTNQTKRAVRTTKNRVLDPPYYICNRCGPLAGGRSASTGKRRERGRCGEERRALAEIQKLASPFTCFCLFVPLSREQLPASSVDDKYCTKSLEKTPKFSLKRRTRVSAASSPGPP